MYIGIPRNSNWEFLDDFLLLLFFFSIFFFENSSLYCWLAASASKPEHDVASGCSPRGHLDPLVGCERMERLRSRSLLLLLALFQVVQLGRTESVTSENPCTDNRAGDNTVREGIYKFDNLFHSDHRGMFQRNGYIQMKNLIDRDVARGFWKKHFKDVNHQKMGAESQPRRLKINIEGDIMKDARKAFQPVFFMAYQMIAQSTFELRNFHKEEPILYNSSVDWLARLKTDFNIDMHSHNNAALPGSVYQNAHWDVPNSKDEGMVLVDVPLTDVGAKTAPLEIWKGTHRADYRRFFDEPQSIVKEANFRRQYWACFQEMQDAAMRLPSAIVQSKLGDATIRRPSTWHRGTPNNSSKTRDMMTFLMQPSKKKPKPAPTPVSPKTLHNPPAATVAASVEPHGATKRVESKTHHTKKHHYDTKHLRSHGRGREHDK